MRHAILFGMSVTIVGPLFGPGNHDQINVRIPSTIPAVESCGTTCSHVACTIYNTVTSNLTVNIGANLS